MAVLIEGISVVIRGDPLDAKYPGGWEGFRDSAPNETLCCDKELVRVGFMTPEDVGSFIKKLERVGLVFLRDDEAIDIAVVDQIRGPTRRCTWLEFGHVELSAGRHRVAMCRLVGSQLKKVLLPVSWEFEQSLSSSFGFTPTEHAQKTSKFLRHEDGVDIYLSYLTGEEMYVGRTDDS